MDYTIERRGRREMERPKGGPAREWERASQIYSDGQQGDAQETCAGDAFSNLFTSELARDCENTSLSRSACGPAFRALREMKRMGQQFL